MILRCEELRDKTEDGKSCKQGRKGQETKANAGAGAGPWGDSVPAMDRFEHFLQVEGKNSRRDNGGGTPEAPRCAWTGGGDGRQAQRWRVQLG